MLDHSAAYAAAITADARRVYVRAVADISDPDKEWLPVTGSPEAPWSKPAELHDHNFDAPARYATMEPGRCLLDRSFDLFPEDYQVSEPVGDVRAALSGPDGTFEPAQVISLNFAGVYVLQACSVFFSADPMDGTAEDFTVEVMQGGGTLFRREVAGNREASVSFSGFTVYSPDCIRVTVTRWSLPGRRVRTVEIVPGLYEDWSADRLEGFSVTQQGQFSCLTLPYGTAEIAMDNSSRRFDPRRKDGIFQSIEERQGVELFIGVLLEDRTVEYKPLGLYYQAGNGWKTSSNAAIMKWSLVDIAGLLANRTFLPPAVLPSTLEGWISAVVAQLGEHFRRRYHVDPDYANISVTAYSAEDVTGKSCGDIIRWACMASGTWPRADAETGKLTAEPLWNQGGKVTLDNLTAYPAMQANESLAALVFQLALPPLPEGQADTRNREFVVSGNSSSSEKTVTIQNPFIHTPGQALTAARLILSQYGGNVIETAGRGDPASEIGDVDTIWLDESSAVTARRMSQTLQIRDGALQDCRSRHLQADGSYLYTEFAIITRSGLWKAPPGVLRLRIVLGQGGQGGGYGQDGYIRWHFNTVEAGYGEPGQDGKGGAVWYGVIDINPEQEFSVCVGAGGAAGSVPGEPGVMGQHTTFGPYSSANGTIYPNGYTDIANGQSFARAGVPAPLPGTGDGGRGGDGGEAGAGYLYKNDGDIGYRFQLVSRPGPGLPGTAGASGFVMVTWEKEREDIG